MLASIDETDTALTFVHCVSQDKNDIPAAVLNDWRALNGARTVDHCLGVLRRKMSSTHLVWPTALTDAHFAGISFCWNAVSSRSPCLPSQVSTSHPLLLTLTLSNTVSLTRVTTDIEPRVKMSLVRKRTLTCIGSSFSKKHPRLKARM